MQKYGVQGVLVSVSLERRPVHSLLRNAAEAASLEKAHGHGVGNLHSCFFFFLHSFNGNRRVCCVEELDIVFRELYFGVSIVKSGRILGANKIMVRASVGGGGPDGVG